MPEHPIRPQGFDAPVEDAANDHLNRWPLAQQIYNVAANGPIDWSVRIGVYGEWGTGKTSVLKFVSSVAELDGHIVVWFDPWAFTDQTEMWRAYVRSIHKASVAKLGDIEETKALREDGWLAIFFGSIPRLLKCWKKEVGELASDGLGWIRKYLSKRDEALRNLKNVMNGKRVFVFVDDLDRTAAELVPDILYALKQIMDFPGFSFICGFDPTVVGKVLRAKHRGFGDGLKFLEKIIDYPIWLPPIKPEGLAKLALADRERHCPFVPAEDLKQILPDLPQNPRAIRQFMRLLSLLKSQTNRYHDYELRWSVILASTTLKVHYPKIADALLLKREFWESLSVRDIINEDSWQGGKAAEDIHKHIKDTLKSLGQSLGEPEQIHLGSILHRIGRRLSFWSSDDVALVISQIAISEQPQAVTWKEFDEFLTNLDFTKLHESLKTQIVKHAQNQHHRESDVVTELCMAAVDRYCSELHKADVGFDPTKMPQHQHNALKAFHLLEALVLDVGKEFDSFKNSEWIPLSHLFDKLASLYSASGPTHVSRWPQTESFLLKLANDCAIDLKRLSAIFDKLSREERGDAKEQQLLRKLNSVLTQHACHKAASSLTQESFANHALMGHADFSDSGVIIRSWNQSQFEEFRSLALSLFKSDIHNPNLRENAYRIVNWLESAFRRQDPARKQSVEQLLQDKEMVVAVWNAATFVPFAARHAYELRNFPNILTNYGINVSIPPWWETSIREYEDFIQSLTPKAEESLTPEIG